MSRIAAPLTVAALSALLLTACTGTPGPDSSTPPASSPPASSSAPATSSPPASPNPTATADASDATCDSLISDTTRTKLESQNYAPYDASKLAERSPFAHFVEYGGILCGWGIPQSDGVLAYAYGPITQAQTTQMESDIEAGTPSGTVSSTGTNKNGGTYYIVTGQEAFATQVYVFSPKGYWAYTSTEQVDIQDLVAHTPVFY